MSMPQAVPETPDVSIVVAKKAIYKRSMGLIIG